MKMRFMGWTERCGLHWQMAEKLPWLYVLCDIYKGACGEDRMFRFLTAGESHGPALTAIIEGLPAGLPLDIQAINEQLRRRQGGYGRGGRMKIEQDEVRVLAGVRHGRTLGSPIALLIENKDWINWQDRMAIEPLAEAPEAVTRIRPGHADFTGAIKYGHDDIRNVIERASSRETAARVAVGAVCRQLLAQFGVRIHSQVLAIGGVGYGDAPRDLTAAGFPDELWERVEASPVRCADPELTERMIARINEGKRRGDTCGGIFEVVALGLPVGLGSYSQWDRRLSGRIGLAMMSIPAVKGVELGGGFAMAALGGAQVHDVLRYDASGWHHLTNNAGGLEGGITNGEPLVVRVAIKPIPTLAHPLPSVDLHTRENIEATRYERSDVCVVPAAGVVGEAMLAIVLAEAWIEKFGGDSLEEMRRNYLGYCQQGYQR
jgi:chorismate synthase